MPAARTDLTTWSSWDQSKEVGPPYWTQSQLASSRIEVMPMAFIAASWDAWTEGFSAIRSGSDTPNCPPPPVLAWVRQASAAGCWVPAGCCAPAGCWVPASAAPAVATLSTVAPAVTAAAVAAARPWRPAVPCSHSAVRLSFPQEIMAVAPVMRISDLLTTLRNYGIGGQRRTSRLQGGIGPGLPGPFGEDIGGHPGKPLGARWGSLGGASWGGHMAPRARARGP